MAQYKAAWYPDPSSPSGSGVLRYYDGTAWTSHVHRPDAPSRSAATAVRAGAPPPAPQRVPQQRAAPPQATAQRPAPQRPGPRPTPATRPRPPATRTRTTAAPRSGASWDSIPQPGTTFTSDGFRQTRGRAGRWLATLLVLAVVVGLVLYLT